VVTRKNSMKDSSSKIKDTHPVSITLPNTGFMRLPDVLAVIPIGKTTWYKWINEGKAPKGTRLAPKIIAWKVNDIKVLIKNLEDESDDLHWPSVRKRIKKN